MTPRTDLIEKMAQARCPGYDYKNMAVQYECRAAQEKLVPVIEEFVGVWMLDNIDDADAIVTRWREDLAK